MLDLFDILLKDFIILFILISARNNNNNNDYNQHTGLLWRKGKS